MQIRTLIMGLLFSILSTTALAGSGHDHGHSQGHGHSHDNTPINETTAKANAVEYVAALVKKDKLDNSWASISASEIQQISVNGNPEWKIVFVNENIADTEKQNLYVFLTLGGDYIAANFTGK